MFLKRLVARAGVQPATFALGVRRSMQLSYRATSAGTIGRPAARGAAHCVRLKPSVASSPILPSPALLISPL